MVALGIETSPEQYQACNGNGKVEENCGYTHKTGIEYPVANIFQKGTFAGKHLHEQYKDTSHSLEQKEKQ